MMMRREEKRIETRKFGKEELGGGEGEWKGRNFVLENSQGRENLDELHSERIN